MERRGPRQPGGPPHQEATGSVTHPAWQSLSERLNALRRAKIDSAAASVEFLKRLLELAKDVVETERAEAEGHLDQFQLLDPDKGALTQILEECAPPNVPVCYRERYRTDRCARTACPRHGLANKPTEGPGGPQPAAARAEERRATSTGPDLRQGLRVHRGALLRRFQL